MSTKFIEVNSGPHKKLRFIGHESAEAYDQQAGQVGACVETADASDVYRSLLPEAHSRFVDVLKTSGIARGVNADATAKAKEKAKDPTKVEAVPESYLSLANRVKATLEAKGPDGVAQWLALDAKIHEIAESMACDSSPTARQKGPDKACVAKADSILARDTNAMEATLTKMYADVPGFDLERDADGKPERMSLARFVEEFYKASL